MCEMIGDENDRNRKKNSVKEYTIESIKLIEIIIPKNMRCFKMKFSRDDLNNIHVWLKISYWNMLCY
jgi:hypothetical protein